MVARVGTAVIVGLCLATLSACSDRMIDTGPYNYVLGGGAPPDAPTPIKSMSGVVTSYPNLGDVPARPTDIPTYEARQADIRRLSEARADNRAAADAVSKGETPAVSTPYVTPLAVPPPPRLSEGAPQY